MATKDTKKRIKIHFAITCMTYFCFGFGLGVQLMGIKAGLGFWPTTIIWSSSVIILIIVVFTSLEKVKDYLNEKY